MIATLSECFSPSGMEDRVREVIQRFLPSDLPTFTDALGNLYVEKKPLCEERGTIMLCAHMDEVGMIVTRICEDGTLAFQTIGGISPLCLLGKRVRIGTKEVLGVIGSESVHLLSKSEKEAPLSVSDMVIDIGTSCAEETQMLISVGDCAVFDTAFFQTDDCFYGKALDDRLGCAVLIELLQNYQPQHYRIFACFTVQEEPGIRGAKIAAARIKPDVALVLETTTCNDFPSVAPKARVTELGKGVALSVADAYTLYSPAFRDFLCQTAEKEKIPYQFKNQTYGGNDCGNISIANGGVPTAVLSIPCRYLHTPLSMVAQKDYQSCLDLASAFLREMEMSTWNF